MSSRFASILRRIHNLERQEQVRIRNDYLAHLNRAQARLKRQEARQELDSRVTAVLEDFRQVAYPRLKLRTNEQGWSLGNWKNKPDGSLLWESTVDVTVHYDDKNRPNGLDCSGHNHNFTIPINLDTLAATLIHIYRPHTHRRDAKK